MQEISTQEFADRLTGRSERSPWQRVCDSEQEQAAEHLRQVQESRQRPVTLSSEDFARRLYS